MATQEEKTAIERLSRALAGLLEPRIDIGSTLWRDCFF